MESNASAVAASLPSYATLLNLKIVLPSSTSDYLAVDRHLFYNCMRGLLSHVKVDADWYLDRYKDVREAIAQNVVSSAHEHYIRFGYYEHRMPFRIDVEEGWYLDTYPDVREAIARKHFRTGQHHFLVTGYKEGRLPYPHFTLSAPKDQVPEARRAPVSKGVFKDAT